MHTLLDNQIKRSTEHEGDVDLIKLYDYISAAYDDQDRDRIRTDRANWLMSEELGELHDNLETVVDELSVQNLRFEMAIENMTQGLCMIKVNGEVAVVNKRFLEVYQIDDTVHATGVDLSDLLSSSRLLNQLSDFKEISRFVSVMTNNMTDADQETRQTFPSGEVISITSLPMKDGGLVLTIEDITERVTVEARIRHQAHHDSLTGLPNRLNYQIHLADTVDACKRNNNKLMLMYIDLDHFKEVNDTLGHDAGDELLRQATQRIKKLLDKDDLFARIGGDEFAIIKKFGTSKKLVKKLAQTIIDTVSKPYDISDQTAIIGASIGISLAGGETPGELQKKADLALYSAKNSGRGEFRFFKKHMNREFQTRKALETDMYHAVNRDEFEVHYQPLISTLSGKITSFEALVRWNHPERGLIAPLDFIRLAEETGKINAIGEFVLRRACDTITSYPDQSIAVNFSPVQFRNPNLVATVRRHLEEINFDPEKLTIEITENTLLNNNSRTMKTLTKLKDLGISIAMDDFGTGYSSLSYLRQFPFDKIKIDRKFVQDIANNQNDQAIVDSIVYLGQRLGMTVVAEGIESKEQAVILRAAGCDEMQGFYYSRPVHENLINTLMNKLDVAALTNRKVFPRPRIVRSRSCNFNRQLA